MKIQIITEHLTGDEQETTINFIMPDGVSGAKNRIARAETTYMPDFNKFKRKNWTQIEQYEYEDGTVCGGVFEASIRGISFRDPAAKKREFTEEQKNAAREKMKIMRAKMSRNKNA